MHLYSNPNSYHGEYLKREKCIIDLQEENVFAVYLQGSSTTPTFHSFSLFQTSRCCSLFRKVHLVRYMGQYSECNVDISLLSSHIRKSFIEIAATPPPTRFYLQSWMDNFNHFSVDVGLRFIVFFSMFNSLCLCERHHFPLSKSPAVVIANFHCHQGDHSRAFPIIWK